VTVRPLKLVTELHRINNKLRKVEFGDDIVLVKYMPRTGTVRKSKVKVASYTPQSITFVSNFTAFVVYKM